MYCSLELLNYKVPGWERVASGDFDSVQRAIDLALENFDMPVDRIRVKRVDTHEYLEDGHETCDKCGKGQQVKKQRCTECNHCGHRTCTAI